MTPRNVTLGIGVLTVVMGVFALFYPEPVMERVLGFAVDPRATENFVRGEVRAAYGGIFTVVGVYTVLAAMSPWAQRGRILFIGTLWLGACAGRLLGAVVDGSPGPFGWLSATFEAALGLALVAVSQMAEPPAARSQLGVSPAAPPAASSAAPAA